MGKVETTKRIMIATRSIAMTLITSMDVRTITMMMTRAMAVLPTANNAVDGNVEDAYANDADHDDDNC